MVVRVDAAAGVVVDGDHTWSLRLDCRTGGAVVTLGVRKLELDPLRWRSKQRLARWAHLGPETVDHLLADLSVKGDVVLDDAEVAVVAAVAAFLDGGDELPLDPTVLAGVTVDLCRSAGLAPDSLDERDAAEIAALWRAIHGRSPASRPPAPVSPAAGSAAEPWGDATSIRFEPPALDPNRSGPAGERPATAPPERQESVPAPAHEVIDRPSAAPPAPRSDLVDGPRPGDRRVAVYPCVTPSADHTARVPARRSPEWRRTAGRVAAVVEPASAPFAVARPSGPASRAEHALAPPPASPASASVASAPGFPAPAAAPVGPPPPVDPEEIAALRASLVAVASAPHGMAPPLEKPTADADRPAPPVALPAATEPWTAPHSAANGPARTLDEVVAASLDRLATELVAAAEDLGIDV